MSDRLDEIRQRAEAATPGPWGWFGNTDTHNLYLATAKWGRHFVMGFRRFGMQRAQPEFAVGRTVDETDDGMGRITCDGIAPAKDLARYEVAPTATSRDDHRVYRADITGFHNPDAEFIAQSRADVEWLLAEVDRLRSLVTEGADQ